MTNSNIDKLLRKEYMQRYTGLKRLYTWLYTKIYLNFLCKHIKILRPIYETYGTSSMIRLDYLFFQKILGFNRFVPWPVHFSSIVGGARFIEIGIGTSPGYSLGNYITANQENPVKFGDYTIIAPNSCIVGVNHDIHDLRVPVGKGGISIGKYCWIGANSVIVSGVKLGDHTVVAAGSVVTKSFPEGHCVIGGIPAKLIKTIQKDKVIKYEHDFPYKGYQKIVNE